MSDKQQAVEIEAVDQKVVLFMDDELIAVRADDNEVYVSVGHLSDALELDRQGQTQRIERNSVLFSGYRRGEIITSGGPQQTYLLRVDLVPFWLAGVSTQRIKDDIRRQKVEQYQRNVAKVLWEAFQEGRLTAEPGFDDLLASDTPAAQAYKMASAIMKMARQQLLLESRVDTHDARLSQHESRLESIETALGNPEGQVTPEQAMQISQAVKAVSHELGKKSRRNEYGGVYGELYRRYAINSYKNLPKDKYEDAMAWLNEWLQSLISDSPF